jgi:putative addiction module CopG family antidote
MATKTRNISLPPVLDGYLERRVRIGRYGHASAVVQAALRALEREEMGELWRDWQEAERELPRDPITPAIEQQIEHGIRAAQAAGPRKVAR